MRRGEDSLSTAFPGSLKNFLATVPSTSPLDLGWMLEHTPARILNNILLFWSAVHLLIMPGTSHIPTGILGGSHLRQTEEACAPHMPWKSKQVKDPA